MTHQKGGGSRGRNRLCRVLEVVEGVENLEVFQFLFCEKRKAATGLEGFEGKVMGLTCCNRIALAVTLKINYRWAHQFPNLC